MAYRIAAGGRKFAVRADCQQHNCRSIDTKRGCLRLSRMSTFQKRTVPSGARGKHGSAVGRERNAVNDVVVSQGITPWAGPNSDPRVAPCGHGLRSPQCARRD